VVRLVADDFALSTLMASVDPSAKQQRLLKSLAYHRSSTRPL
jgi:hypothetical protein